MQNCFQYHILIMQPPQTLVSGITWARQLLRTGHSYDPKSDAVLRKGLRWAFRCTIRFAGYCFHAILAAHDADWPTAAGGASASRGAQEEHAVSREDGRSAGIPLRPQSQYVLPPPHVLKSCSGSMRGQESGLQAEPWYSQMTNHRRCDKVLAGFHCTALLL